PGMRKLEDGCGRRRQANGYAQARAYGPIRNDEGSQIVLAWRRERAASAANNLMGAAPSRCQKTKAVPQVLGSSGGVGTTPQSEDGGVFPCLCEGQRGQATSGSPRQTRQKIPQGPSIWTGGERHLSNLGPIAGVERQIDIQIRDLDQTVVGNPAHDGGRNRTGMS